MTHYALRLVVTCSIALCSSSVFAQTWGVRAQGSVSVITPAGTDNSAATVDSGNVPNAFAGNGVDTGTHSDTFSGTTGFVRAQYSGSASLGNLRGTVDSSATTTGGASPNNERAVARGTTQFSDSFTFTDPSLAPGAPTSIRISVSLVDQITVSGNHSVSFEDSGAAALLTISGVGNFQIVHAAEGPSFQRQVYNVSLPNGVATNISLVLTVNAARTISGSVVPGGAITVDASNGGASFGIEAVNPGVQYSTASGRQYPSSVPDSAAPQITGIDVMLQAARIRFTTTVGRNYRVEAKNDNINSSPWAPLPGAEVVAGTGAGVQVIDPNSSSYLRRFYRVVLLP